MHCVEERKNYSLSLFLSFLFFSLWIYWFVTSTAYYYYECYNDRNHHRDKSRCIGSNKRTTFSFFLLSFFLLQFNSTFLFLFFTFIMCRIHTYIHIHILIGEKWKWEGKNCWERENKRNIKRVSNNFTSVLTTEFFVLFTNADEWGQR